MTTLLERLSLFIPLSLCAALAGCDPLVPGTDPDGSSDPIVNKTCGGLLGKGCEKGFYCDYAADAQCGAADQTGTCKAAPEVCTDEYDPVCGCDDRTYGNACEAHAKGVSVASQGACRSTPNPVDASVDAAPEPRPDAGNPTTDAGKPPSARVCGGIAGLSCGRGEFCDYGATCSSIADGTGMCRTQPQVCDASYVPVCGCDGNTYGNECSAHAKGVSIASKGECKKPDPGTDGGTTGKVCGGFAALRCAAGEFCDYGAVCSSIADGSGVCATKPQACTEQYAPVCGCDGKTYGNACAAHSAGMSIASKGECKKLDPAGKTCGGIAGLTCDKGQFCNYEPPRGQGCDGTIADAAGVCDVQPQACTLQYDPVCGCDGNTYGNACAAHSAGMSVAGRGECKPRRVSCDHRAILCKRAEPQCPAGQVASVEGSCYGPCVNVEQCTCKEAAACPQPDTYTCHLSRGVCGPYVN